MTALAGGFPSFPCGEQFTDLADTAAVVEETNMVVTVDTAVAHLAGRWARTVSERAVAFPTGAGCWNQGPPVVRPCACSRRREPGTGESMSRMAVELRNVATQ